MSLAFTKHHYCAYYYIRKTYILLYRALLCFFLLFLAFSCFSVKAREKYNKSNPPYFFMLLVLFEGKKVTL